MCNRLLLSVFLNKTFVVTQLFITFVIRFKTSVELKTIRDVLDDVFSLLRYEFTSQQTKSSEKLGNEI